jgi:hypothetical protein
MGGELRPTIQLKVIEGFHHAHASPLDIVFNAGLAAQMPAVQVGSDLFCVRQVAQYQCKPQFGRAVVDIALPEQAVGWLRHACRDCRHGLFPRCSWMDLTKLMTSPALRCRCQCGNCDCGAICPRSMITIAGGKKSVGSVQEERQGRKKCQGKFAFPWHGCFTTSLLRYINESTIALNAPPCA